jgi:prepilin peptidase CpaA
MESWVAGAVVVALGGLAAWFDVLERRVPNSVTVPALVAGLAIGAIGGWEGLGWALGGAAFGFLFALPFFLVGGLGAGDLKLLTAFGALLGPGRLLTAIVVMGLVGGAMAFFAMVRRRAVLRTFRNLWLLALTFGRSTFTGWKGESSEAWLTLDSEGAVTVPYAVAISSGALFAWFI